MKKTQILFTISIIILSFSLSCVKQEKAKPDISILLQKDSMYTHAQTTIYTDPLTTRERLKRKLDEGQIQDSIYWYAIYNLYIKTFLVTSELDSILPLCQKAEDFCARQKEMTSSIYLLLAHINNNIGNRYSLSSINDSSLKYSMRMLEYCQHTIDTRMLMIAHINVADAYVRSGHFDKGAWYYRQSLYIADSLHLPGKELISSYTGLGQTYAELRNFELSHYYYNLASKHLKDMDMHQKFISFINHGNTYYFEQKYPEALSLFKQGYNILKTSPEYKYPLNITMVNIGEIYLLMGQLDSAEYYLEQSFAYFKAIDNSSVLYHLQTQIFELALRKGNITEATRILNTMFENPSTEPTLVGIRRKYLQHYYEETGNFKNAYQYLKENIQTDDSIRNERIRMNTAETELRYKQDTTLIKQKLFIQEQHNEINSMKLNAFIWILVCALLLIIAIFIYFYHKKQQAYLLAETRNKIIGLRMENIRNRVSPHFIFNTLNRAISHYEETDSHYKELYNLIKIMRLNLRLTEKLCITLEEEIDFVKTYLAIEQEQIGSSLQVSIDISKEIDLQKVEIPSMMIQIPVENAIKHGLRGKEGKKLLSITITKESGNTLICIEDNGSGFRVQTEQRDMQSTGTGIKVLSQTILLLNTNNKNPIQVEIQKSKSGTNEYPGCLVQFILPDDYLYTL